MDVWVLGSINLDNVCRVSHIPVAGETIMAQGLRRFAGGKGANQAVAAAAWGARTAMIGAVGEDEAGEFLLAHLARSGVDTRAVARIAGEPSGQAHICVSDDGENMIVVIGGVNRTLTAAHVSGVGATDGAVVLAQLETPIETVEALYAIGAAGGATTILNAAPAVAAGRALFPLADIIVVNQGELALYAGSAEPATPDEAIPLARALIDRPDQTIIVTLGAAGALAVTASGHAVVDGRPARVVDTTGAGDCFCGVLAAALAGGGDIMLAMGWANAAAAISTEHAGAAAPADLRALAASRF